MKVEAQFVRSAARASDLPRDGLAEIAIVGRSNVGKSTLINALVRTRVARTGSAPGTTRLANIYRVARVGTPPFYIVDLPGFGYARGGRDTAAEFQELTRAYFGGERQEAAHVGALLIVDARHPGLESDLQAWRWLKATGRQTAVVAAKIDKLARGERIRALGELESVFHDPVLPVSAATGEGLDELWKLIDRLANSRNNPQTHNSRRNRPSRATAPLPRAVPATPAKARG